MRERPTETRTTVYPIARACVNQGRETRGEAACACIAILCTELSRALPAGFSRGRDFLSCGVGRLPCGANTKRHESRLRRTRKPSAPSLAGRTFTGLVGRFRRNRRSLRRRSLRRRSPAPPNPPFHPRRASRRFHRNHPTKPRRASVFSVSAEGRFCAFCGRTLPPPRSPRLSCPEGFSCAFVFGRRPSLSPSLLRGERRFSTIYGFFIICD